MVLTIPRLLRPLFRRRRDLLTELARAGAEATVELVRREAGPDVRPGLIISLATAGDLLQWHPHLHLLTTDGGFAPDGSFIPLPEWNATLLMTLFRERILASLLDRHAISPELVQKLLGWRHPGFSAHVGESIPAQDRQRLEDTAPTLCETPSRSESSSNSTASRPSSTAPAWWDESEWPAASAESPRRRCSPTWARLIAKIYQMDPLVCTRCGQKMQMIAFLTDQLCVRRTGPAPRGLPYHQPLDSKASRPPPKTPSGVPAAPLDLQASG